MWLCGYRFIILSMKSTKIRVTRSYLPVFGFYQRLHLLPQSICIYLIVLCQPLKDREYVSIQCHVLSLPLSGRTQEVFMSIKDLENLAEGKEVHVSIKISNNMLFKHVRSLLSS